MLDGYLAATIIIAIVFVSIGGITLSRNPSSSLHRYFMLFSFFLAAWLIANHLAGTTRTGIEIALWANRLTFIFAGLSVVSTLLFVSTLIKPVLSRNMKFFVAVSLILIALGGTSLVVAQIKPEDDTYLINFGFLSPLYFAAVVANMMLAVYLLFRAKKNAAGSLRAQIYVIQMSFGFGLGIIFVTNAILPSLFGIYRLADIGPFFSSLFVIGISYAIIKHRLFDIRLVVARSIGYVLSIGSLAVIYGLVAFTLTESLLFDESLTKAQQQLLYTLLAVVLAFTFQPLKKFFNRVTNRIFYRDAYNPQVLIDELNQAIVSTIDVNKLLKLATTVIERHIKPEFCAFGIRGTEYAKQRVVGNNNPKLNYSDINLLQTAFLTDKKVLVLDHLDASSAQLQKKMQKNDISVIAKLATDVDSDGVGFIAFGPKKSGNPYNSQDIQVVEIIANSMIIAIGNAMRFEEIQKFNITLQEKIDSATRELRRTNVRLKELDETKDEFISMASHQLRTPLTSVKGYLSMVLEGDTGKLNTQQEKLLQQAFISSQRMVYLISDLLNVSRLRTGKFVIERVPTDLPAIVQGEIDQLKETAEARGLKVKFNQPKDFPLLYLDETKIRQVVMNFIDNAIYYTPQGGKITVELEEKPQSVELRVIDTGIGVPKRYQHELFGKFYRAENARRVRPDGTGLGLFMAKKVIIAQGGATIFRSIEGKGSTFGFTFPKNKLKIPEKA